MVPLNAGKAIGGEGDRPVLSVTTVDSIVAGVQRGTFSCRSVVQHTLDKINAGDGEVNSFISLLAGRALDRAAQLDALNPLEKQQLPLLGVPVAIKDNICTSGHPTTCASKMLDGFIPPYDATVVELLEGAGAIIIGKTNMDEFAMGSSGETSYFGCVKNPLNKGLVPGGSSSGSAAAVSAGFVSCALGSDTGGSIRQPCSHCGVVGIKPTYGRVSRYGLVAYASSLDQIGPIARNVRDTALLLSVIAGRDTRDSTCAGKPFVVTDEFCDRGVAGLQIGIPRECFGEGLSGDVRKPIEESILRFREMGAAIIDISLPAIRYAVAAYYIICTAEASSNLARYDGVKYGFRVPAETFETMYETTRQLGFGDEVKRRIMLGTYALSFGYYDAYYRKATGVRALIRKDFENAFTACDVILSPVAPTTAFKLGEKSGDPLEMYLTDIYTVSANLAGIPSLSVPCHVPAGALPVGVQFMAPHWREDLLFRAGYAVETMTN